MDAVLLLLLLLLLLSLLPSSLPSPQPPPAPPPLAPNVTAAAAADNNAPFYRVTKPFGVDLYAMITDSLKTLKMFLHGFV